MSEYIYQVRHAHGFGYDCFDDLISTCNSLNTAIEHVCQFVYSSGYENVEPCFNEYDSSTNEWKMSNIQNVIETKYKGNTSTFLPNAAGLYLPPSLNEQDRTLGNLRIEEIMMNEFGNKGKITLTLVWIDEKDVTLEIKEDGEALDFEFSPKVKAFIQTMKKNYFRPAKNAEERATWGAVPFDNFRRWKDQKIICID